MHAPTMSQHNQQSSPVPEEPRTAHRAPRWARRTAAFMAAVFWLTQLQLVMVGTAQAQPQPPAGAIAGPFGGPIADPRAPMAFQPGIQSLPGGGALVNITAPNAAGTSLNQYERFDVPTSGVVLNNSLIGGTPLLGGTAAANPNLSGGRAANTIVNEVTVTGTPSQMRGTVEVFGTPATVIIANPNGITCDGCGVVNTPRLTLSTGRPTWLDAGGLGSTFQDAKKQGFDVTGGRIEVRGSGIEGTVGQLDLIGETLSIDAPLRAHYLNQDISSINLTAGKTPAMPGSARAASESPQSPQTPAPVQSGRALAIDATALGAMTAGQIRVISTDAGMGVNLQGPLLAYQRDVEIQSAGRVSTGSLASARDIRIDSDGYVSVAGEVSAGKQLQVSGRDGMQFNGPVQAQGDIRLQSAQGGIAVSGDLVTAGSLQARAGGDLQMGSGASTVQVAGATTLGGKNVHQTGKLLVGGDLAIDAGEGASLGGVTAVAGSLDMRAGQGALLSGQLQVNRSAKVSADTIDVTGRSVVGENFQLDGVRSVDLIGSAHVGQSLSMEAGTVGINGDISAGETNVDASRVDLGSAEKGLSIGGDLNLRVGDSLHARGDVSVTGSANLSSGGDARFDGAITAGRDLGLSAGGDLTMAGPVTSGGKASFNAAGNLTAHGDILAGGGITGKAGGDIRLGGQVGSAGSQQWSAGGDFSADKGMEAAGLSVEGRNIRIAGDVLSQGAVNMKAGQKLQLGGDLRSAGSTTLSAGAEGITAKSILTNEDLDIRSQGNIALEQAQAARDVRLESSTGSIATGNLLAGRDAGVTAAGNVLVDGTLHAGRDARIAAKGDATVRGDAYAGRDVALSGSSISLDKGLQAGGDLRLEAGDGGIASRGQLVANRGITALSAGQIDVQGPVLSGENLQLRAGRDITVAGDIAAMGTMDIRSAQALKAERLQAGADLDVAAASVHTRSVLAQGQATLRADDALRIQGDLMGAGIDATARTGAISVTGTVATPGALSLKAGTDAEAGKVVAGTADGQAAVIDAGGNIRLQSLETGGAYQARAGGSHEVAGAATVQGPVDIAAGADITVGADAAFGQGLAANAGGRIAVAGDTLVLGDARLQSGAGQSYGETSGGKAGGQMRVTGRLDASAGQGFAVGKELRVNDGMDIEAKAGAIDVGGGLATLGDARLQGSDGVRVGGDLQLRKGELASSGGAIAIAGKVSAEQDLGLKSRGDIAIGGATVAQGRLTARSEAGSISFGGNLDVAGDFDAHAAQNLGFEGNSLFLGEARLKADNGAIRNRGDMTFAKAVDIDTGGDLSNEGLIQSQQDISIRARNIDSNLARAGGIVTPGKLTVQAGGATRLGSQGKFSAGQDMALQAAGGTSSQGTIQAGGNLTHGGTLSSSGSVVADDITINGALGNQGGSVYAQGSLGVSGSTSNSGNIAASTITMAAVDNSGQIGAQGISLGATGNSGSISGSSVGIDGSLSNSGSIGASGSLDVYGGSISNSGSLAGGDVTLSGSSIGNDGQIQSSGSLSISGGSFDNGLTESRSCVSASGCGAGSAPEDWRYSQDPGTVHAGGALTVNVGSMTNKGVVSAGSSVNIQGSLNNTRSVNDPYTSAGASGGASTGIISAGGDLTISGPSVQNAGGQMQAGGAVNITSAGAFSNGAPAEGVTGQIQGSSVTINAASIDNQGTLLAKSGDAKLTASSGGIANTGTVAASGGLQLQASGAVSNGDGANLLGQDIRIKGSGFSNQGTVYGQGGAPGEIDINTTGGFSNSGGTLVAGGKLNIQSGGYSNSGGTVGSLGDATLTMAGAYGATGNELLALGHLQLNVGGINVGASESWSYGGNSVAWTGTLHNQGSVAIAGSAKGSIHNEATGTRSGSGEPDVRDGTYEVPEYPAALAELKEVRVVGYTDVAQRAQLYIGGGFDGSLVNEASDASVGGGSIEQRKKNQTITWEGKNADGDIVTVEGLARSVPRLNTGSGSSTITLVGPDTGTIVGDAITINGGTITVRPGIDPATGLPLVVEARNREVKPGDVAKGPDGQAVKGDVKTGDADKADAPREFKVLGGDPGTIGAGDTKGQGSDIKGPGDEGLPPRTSRPLDLSRPELATPEGGVAALLGGGKSVAWPDWKQMQIVPGGISANDLELNLNGQFINRGQLEVTNNLAIRAAEGIDNFGASIRAGGYTSLSGGGLDNRDGKIETGTLLTSLKGDIDNSRGSIVAHDGGYLQASGNIAATDGRFVSDAGKIVLDAGGNIDLVASKVEGKKGAGLYADGDIRLGAAAKAESTHTKEDQILVTQHYDADNNLTDPEIRIKIGETQRRTDTLTHTGTTIDGGEGSVTLRAKGDVVALGSHIKAGEDVLVQGASVRVEALVDKSSSLEEEHRKNYDHALFQRSESLSGGEIEAGRNLSIVANGKADAGKGDITLKGATVTAKGDASLIASRDVNLQDKQTEHGRFEETYSKKSGFLSKKSTHTVEEGASSLSEGSVLSANNIYLQAGRDISVTGSHVVGQGDVGLVAGRDVQLLAGQDSAAATSHSQTKKSGLFSGGGFGITLGSKSVTIDRSNESVRAAGSSVQAQGGNASIVAGNQYRQTGSAVLAQGDVNIVGKSVEINEARELERDKFEMRAKQSGLSVSISNPVVNVVQGGETVARIAGATGNTSDARMQALGAAAAGMAAYETYGKASQLIADPSSATSVGISLSLGKSSSRSTSEYQVNSAVGSLVKADGNVSITATQGDVHVRGSSVEAGKDVRLAADKGNIVLEAAENRFAEQNSQSSSSASVGVAFTLGSKNGFSVNVGLSQGKGSGSGESLSHTNTHIKAGGTASVQSGGDTTLKGATIVADTVKADIGGNLAIESLQDESTYNEKSSSAGLNVSLCVPPLCYGASSVGGSAGRTRIDSDYQSVVEQSGIRAGDGGFDVKVKGDNTLKGGAITSTQVAMDDGKNRFETGGKLTTSDIENHAEYDASGWSAGGSVGFQAGDQSTAKTEEQKKAALDTGKGLTGGSAGVGSDSGNASSTTKAGISGVAGDSGARTGDKETGLKPIFDKDKVRENVNAQIEITREFGSRASKAVGDFADSKLKEAMANGDEAEIEKWKEGGAGRVALHALVGAAGGGLAGAAGAGLSQVAVAHLDETLKELGVDEGARNTLVAVAGTAVGAVAGGAAGAAASTNATLNNFLNHKELTERAKSESACQKGDKAACGEVSKLDARSAKRNEDIRKGLAPATVDQNLEIQEDLGTVVTELAKYKDQLYQQLGATADPQRRADLMGQISAADNNIKQLAVLGQDNLLYLYGKTDDPKYWSAYKQLQAASNGNEFADVLMSGTALIGKLRRTSVTNGTEGTGNLGGNGQARNPLLDDALPRNGDRAVYGQGEGTVTCGHNSCGMVLDTLGKPVDVPGIIQRFPAETNGIKPEVAATILRANGVDAVSWGNRNTDDLAKYTANGTPVIVRIANNETGFSHFVVVDGVTTTNTGQKVVAIRDPLSSGKQYFSPIDSFNKVFSGDVIVPRKR